MVSQTSSLNSGPYGCGIFFLIFLSSFFFNHADTIEKDTYFLWAVNDFKVMEFKEVREIVSPMTMLKI